MKSFVSLSQKSHYNVWTKTKDMNQNFLKAEYAVRGLVPSTAAKIQQEINKGAKYPFDSITELNIGNPQTFGQKPITFNRQVISTLLNPQLLHSQSKDVQRRVNYYQDGIGVAIGAYSPSPGFNVVREAVAKFIQKRDSTKSKPKIDNIILTDGASQGINMMLNLLVKEQNDGVMIPIPQYPLYSAVIDQCGAQQIPYYLEEQSGWSISRVELEKQYNEAISKGINPKVLVCINPGNPTGQVLDKETIADIIKFAEQKKLVLFADEVYQENIYDSKKQFVSFRKVKEELNINAELFSFHSISKGIHGECGLRGGYMEMSDNLDPEFVAQIQKTKTVLLCSNTVGQVLTGLMVQPPSAEEGCSSETLHQYQEECSSLFSSLVKRAGIVSDFLNQTKGISCQPIEGAMYAFPSVQLSDKFIQHAKSQNQVPDVYYSLQLLKETGLVVVPGSGFHQYPGTHHFRMTILILPEEKLLEKMKVFKNWHENFMRSF